ncbi:hypothetical protein ANO11243_032670 [Dothideomycetidae sp. 11243]|nr:hypothetical protein ANO11243_032670 [fungal sp. No.11243]
MVVLKATDLGATIGLLSLVGNAEAFWGANLLSRTSLVHRDSTDNLQAKYNAENPSINENKDCSVPCAASEAKYASPFPLTTAYADSAILLERTDKKTKDHKEHPSRPQTPGTVQNIAKPTRTTTQHHKKKKHHTATPTTTTTVTMADEQHEKHKHHKKHVSTVRTEWITQADEVTELIVLATPTTITVTVEYADKAKNCPPTTVAEAAVETQTPADTAPVNVGVSAESGGEGVVSELKRAVGGVMGLGARRIRGSSF